VANLQTAPLGGNLGGGKNKNELAAEDWAVKKVVWGQSIGEKNNKKKHFL